MRSQYVLCTVLVSAGCAMEVGEEDMGLDEVELRAVLDVANDLEVAELEADVGLDAPAAEALVRYKLGDDGVGGTLDDLHFDALETLLSIDHVGPVSIDFLLTYAEERGFMDAPDDSEVLEATTDCWDWSEGELLFMQLINRSRSSRDIATISRDMHLGKVTRRWSGIMADRNDLAHNPHVASQVTNWTALGENVGVTTASIGTLDERVRRLHTAFMNSAVHKANILGRSYRFQGVGIRYGFDGMWVTEVFSGTGNPGTTLDMPQCN